MELRRRKNGTLRPFLKKEIRAEMEKDAGNWLSWENFWRIDQSRFADPKRGTLVYIDTEIGFSNALVLRALMRAVGSEKETIWNGTPHRPFRYAEMFGYVSAMFFVRDENGAPTPEYLMYLYLTSGIRDWPYLDDQDMDFRERLRCLHAVTEELTTAVREKRSWDFPEDADQILFDEWEKQESINEHAMDEMTYPSSELVRSVAEKKRWKRISGHRLEEQRDIWSSRTKNLERSLVRLPQIRNLASELQQLVPEVLKLRDSFR